MAEELNGCGIINNDRQVSAIILAAGKSMRMGRQKLLLPVAGSTILGKTIDNVRKAGIRDVLLVCGYNSEEVCRTVDSSGIKIIINPDYEKGQMTSVKAGLDALLPGQAALFVLGDQPFIDCSVYKKLIEAYHNSEALIVVPITEDGRRGNPVIFSPELFAEIRLLEGDNGPRSLIEKYSSDTKTVLIRDEMIHLDIDTPQTYEECLKKEGV